jgi:hypothetical protein
VPAAFMVACMDGIPEAYKMLLGVAKTIYATSGEPACPVVLPGCSAPNSPRPQELDSLAPTVVEEVSQEGLQVQAEVEKDGNEEEEEEVLLPPSLFPMGTSFERKSGAPKTTRELYEVLIAPGSMDESEDGVRRDRDAGEVQEDDEDEDNEEEDAPLAVIESQTAQGEEVAEKEEEDPIPSTISIATPLVLPTNGHPSPTPVPISQDNGLPSSRMDVEVYENLGTQAPEEVVEVSYPVVEAEVVPADVPDVEFVVEAMIEMEVEVREEVEGEEEVQDVDPVAETEAETADAPCVEVAVVENPTEAQVGSSEEALEKEESKDDVEVPNPVAEAVVATVDEPFVKAMEVEAVPIEEAEEEEDKEDETSDPVIEQEEEAAHASEAEVVVEETREVEVEPAEEVEVETSLPDPGQSLVPSLPCNLLTMVTTVLEVPATSPAPAASPPSVLTPTASSPLSHAAHHTDHSQGIPSSSVPRPSYLSLSAVVEACPSPNLPEDGVPRTHRNFPSYATSEAESVDEEGRSAMDRVMSFVEDAVEGLGSGLVRSDEPVVEEDVGGDLPSDNEGGLDGLAPEAAPTLAESSGEQVDESTPGIEDRGTIIEETETPQTATTPELKADTPDLVESQRTPPPVPTPRHSQPKSPTFCVEILVPSPSYRTNASAPSSRATASHNPLLARRSTPTPIHAVPAEEPAIVASTSSAYKVRKIPPFKNQAQSSPALRSSTRNAGRAPILPPAPQKEADKKGRAVVTIEESSSMEEVVEAVAGTVGEEEELAMTVTEEETVDDAQDVEVVDVPEVEEAVVDAQAIDGDAMGAEQEMKERSVVEETAELEDDVAAQVEDDVAAQVEDPVVEAQVMIAVEADQEDAIVEKSIAEEAEVERGATEESEEEVIPVPRRRLRPPPKRVTPAKGKSRKRPSLDPLSADDDPDSSPPPAKRLVKGRSSPAKREDSYARDTSTRSSKRASTSTPKRPTNRLSKAKTTTSLATPAIANASLACTPVSRTSKSPARSLRASRSKKDSGKPWWDISTTLDALASTKKRGLSAAEEDRRTPEQREAEGETEVIVADSSEGEEAEAVMTDGSESISRRKTRPVKKRKVAGRRQ